LAFLAFAIECTLVHGEPVETCYDSFLAYRELNKAMLGLLYGTRRATLFSSLCPVGLHCCLFCLSRRADAGLVSLLLFLCRRQCANTHARTTGLQIVCSLLLLWLCRGVSVSPWRHVRRTLTDPGARLYEAAMWSATAAMTAYVWWALGNEGVYAMAALITTGVLANTATTSYIAPVDLSERPPLGPNPPRPARGDLEGGLYAAVADTAAVSAAYYCDYSDDDAFYDEYVDDEDDPTPGVTRVVARSPARAERVRPRPGRMRSTTMRTLLLNLFLHNAVLFLYDVTSVLARLEDTESTPLVRRALVLSNLASVWYRGGQALFYYRKYNFAWRNVMIPHFEVAPITPR
jgi:hypothetical protein